MDTQSVKKPAGQRPVGPVVIRPYREKYDIVLGNECSALSAGAASQKVLSIKNDRSKAIQVKTISLVYKAGLEDVLIEIKRSGSNGEIVTGLTQISSIGRERTKDKAADFPVDFTLADTLEIELWVKTKSVPLNAGDICMSVQGVYA
ncbi:hypothetical protein B1J93_17820 [Leptospira kirschneri serovar Pomona]|uniref:Uncharacterized protein n=1 Tax=Leptospira kirschneri serovar Pomona TaxID=561005 RepID=A0A1T1DH71_9LEPT|nr:hypothetical protein [Leptospira kirschneri]OOV40204.1 hypothetical protein B1J93_17820 [Leptospira kirschneri serovar Pomona]